MACLRYFESLPDCKIVYHHGKPHKIDFDITEDASTMPFRYLVDVKGTEERREYYDYGFNDYQYQNYRRLQEEYGIPVRIYFCDWHTGTCVGNDLDNLDQHHVERNKKGKLATYPMRLPKCKMPTGETRDMINFPTIHLRKVFDLLESEITALKQARDDDH